MKVLSIYGTQPARLIEAYWFQKLKGEKKRRWYFVSSLLVSFLYNLHGWLDCCLHCHISLLYYI